MIATWIVPLLLAVIDAQPKAPPARQPEACPGAVYFYNHRSMAEPPRWAKGKKVACRIGAHTFYADR